MVVDGSGFSIGAVRVNKVDDSSSSSLDRSPSQPPRKMSNIVAAVGKTMAPSKLSGVMIVIIIGGGVLLSFVLFIFAKRQIMRFTIRSRRGPHAPVGHDAKKVF